MTHPAPNFQKLHSVAVDCGVLLLAVPPHMEQPVLGELLRIRLGCHGSFRHLLDGVMELTNLSLSQGVGFDFRVELGLVQDFISNPIANAGRESLQDQSKVLSDRLRLARRDTGPTKFSFGLAFRTEIGLLQDFVSRPSTNASIKSLQQPTEMVSVASGAICCKREF